jgi:hypothetical protein
MAQAKKRTVELGEKEANRRMKERIAKAGESMDAKHIVLNAFGNWDVTEAHEIAESISRYSECHSYGRE